MLHLFDLTRLSMAVRAAPLALSAIVLAGCAAVGPNYQRPDLPTTGGYGVDANAPLRADTPQTPGVTQRFVPGAEVPANWWTRFQSPQLNGLIDKALANSPTLQAAEAALRQAQANTAAQRASFFPTVSAQYQPQRTQIAGNTGGNSPGIQGDGTVISTGAGTPASQGGTAPFNTPVDYTFHTAQLNIAYTPDVFGATRRQMESARAQQDLQRYQLAAARTTLINNLVAAAVQDASLRRQIALIEDVVKDNQVALDLAQRQMKAGQSSRVDLSAQQSTLAQAQAQLPPLRKQFEQNRDQMRALAGLMPDAEVPAFNLREFQLPADLPLSLPSRLVEQRPDVRAAEAQLQAASAQVGIARAARLPQFTLDGTIGGTAARFSQMFWNSGQFFNFVMGITQPLFDAGALKQRELAAKAGLEQAAAQYKATAITAFQNVADTLHALKTDADALVAADAANEAARTALNLTRRQHSAGQVDRMALITAEQNHRQAQVNVVQAHASRLTDTAALFQALGGGWWQADAKKTAN